MLNLQADLHEAALPAQRDALLGMLGSAPVAWDDVAALIVDDPLLLHAVLRAAPLAQKRLANTLRDEVAERLNAFGADILCAWLVSQKQAPASRTDIALRGFSQRTALLAQGLARETGYPHGDEARLVGLWSRLAQMLRLDLGRDADPSVPLRALNARLAGNCGCAAPLADALAIAEGTEEQAGDAHPLGAILWCAMRLAMQEDDESLAAIARVSGLDTNTLRRIRDEAPTPPEPSGVLLDELASAMAGLDGQPASGAGIAQTAPGEPSRSLLDAALSGFIGKAFEGLDSTSLRTRFQLATRLLCRTQAELVVVSRKGRLEPVPLVDRLDVSDWYGEFNQALDDEASVIALAVRSATPTSYHRDRNDLPGRSVRDWQLAHWLGQSGFVCVPFSLASDAGAVIIAPDRMHVPAADTTSLLVMLTRAAASVAFAQQEREALENELRVSIEQRYRDHARRIAHEARNPLSVIRNYLQLIPQRHAGIPQLEDDLHLIQDEIDRLGSLLDASVKPPEEIEEAPYCHVTELLHDMRALVGTTLFESRGIHFELRTMTGLPAVAMPASALRQVMLNLLQNAADTLHPGGRCTVAVAGELLADGMRCLEIRVIDNGPGLPAERLTDLFTPQRSTKGGAHQGLGLAISRDILEQWHGQILCRSQQSVGTSFQLLVPVWVSS